jgi:hypothetical protein
MRTIRRQRRHSSVAVKPANFGLWIAEFGFGILGAVASDLAKLRESSSSSRR